MKQLSLIGAPPMFCGGQINLNKRKLRRPLCTKRALHLVLKSCKAHDLFENQKFVRERVLKYCCSFDIRIYGLTVQRDHIHLVLKFKRREQYIKFVRSLTGVLARNFGKGMWSLLPFTRVLNWGRDFKTASDYLKQNEQEVLGILPYKLRNHRYKKWLK